jgi:hypothetical protein
MVKQVMKVSLFTEPFTTDASVRFPFNQTSTIGVLANNLGNADLHWETSKTANIGLDFGLFKGRINGTVDLYETNTEDLLLKRNLPLLQVIPLCWIILVKQQNRGIELSINSENISSKILNGSLF